ncbi:MAG TPA: hypothetical protein VFM61_03435 [Pseudidiomarina sp.]|nr:hypothetical protein [Pseudidiomarina sp.]
MTTPSTQKTPAEQALKARLEQWVELQQSELSLRWQDIQPRSTLAPHRQWLWLAPIATAAAVAWFVVAPLTPTAPAMQPVPPMLLADNYTLDALDQRIQAAYLQGAAPHQIDALWQERAYLQAKEQVL